MIRDHIEEASELYAYSATNPRGAKYLHKSFESLERKQAKGEYERDKAIKLILRNGRDVARQYCMDYAANLAWPVAFPPAAREIWANRVLDDFEAELAAGNSFIGSADNGTE